MALMPLCHCRQGMANGDARISLWRAQGKDRAGGKPAHGDGGAA